MRIAFAAAAAIAALSAIPANAVAPSGDPVLYWNELFVGASWNPGQTRPAALLNIALHDTVNATLGSPDYYYVGYTKTGGGDTRAAAAVAAHDILVTQYPARAAEFAAARDAQLALVPNGAAKTAGIATGATIAAKALAFRANDGSSASLPYSPSGLIGRWAPTPPANLPAAVPQQAVMQSWLGIANDQFRAPPPPTLDSAEYAAAYNLVKEIGSATSATRTAEQSDTARFWAAASGPAPYILAAVGESEAQGLSTLENARHFALLATGIADATIAIWDTKYYYDYWRPVTAIRMGDMDGNGATDVDAAWLPYITTPNHPSYGSAHAAVAGAATAILSGWLGDFNFCLMAAGVNRCFSTWDETADSAAMSRLWGGIHWSFDNEQGLVLGHQVGQFALASDAFGAVPEPASWAMLISGFGVIGLAARRRRMQTLHSGA